MIAGVILAGAVLNMNPQTWDEAVKQQAEVTDEGTRNTDKWIERHHQENEIKALHDIEDAIIFDSIEKGDD